MFVDFMLGNGLLHIFMNIFYKILRYINEASRCDILLLLERKKFHTPSVPVLVFEICSLLFIIMVLFFIYIFFININSEEG